MSSNDENKNSESGDTKQVESQKVTESSDKLTKNKSNQDQQTSCYW